MCDAGPISATRPRPRWRRLYAIGSLAVAAFALSELSVKALALRIALEGAVAVAAWAAVLIWIGANRVALDQLEWCDCAAKTITVRVVLSSPPRSVSPVSGGAAVRPVGDSGDLEDGTRDAPVTVLR